MYIIWKSFLLQNVVTNNFALVTVVKFPKSGMVFVINCEIITECFSSGFRLRKPRKCPEVWLEHLQCLVKPAHAMLDFISCLWHIPCYNCMIFFFFCTSVKPPSRWPIENFVMVCVHNNFSIKSVKALGFPRDEDSDLRLFLETNPSWPQQNKSL